MQRAEAAGTVGGYALAGLIGRGSIGEVHRAVDASGRAVALKLVRLEGSAAGADLRRRFAAEAAVARRLVHPDIVRVHGAGVDGPWGWLAMELLAGCDLSRYTRPARLLPEAVVLALGQRVARALGHAHRQGVVHRDVKPANVIVGWAGNRVTLTDFGMARLAGGESTRTGIVLGSPAYLSPEQLAGGEASPAGDLYALGVMLFELLAGRRPHDAANLGELLRQVAAEPAPDLRTLRPELPPALAELVAQLLAKQPGARPSDADALADRLGRLRAGLEAATRSERRGPMSRT